jgi:hypothetical protein
MVEENKPEWCVRWATKPVGALACYLYRRDLPGSRFTRERELARIRKVSLSSVAAQEIFWRAFDRALSRVKWITDEATRYDLRLQAARKLPPAEAMTPPGEVFIKAALNHLKAALDRLGHSDAPACSEKLLIKVPPVKK